MWYAQGQSFASLASWAALPRAGVDGGKRPLAALAGVLVDTSGNATFVVLVADKDLVLAGVSKGAKIPGSVSEQGVTLSGGPAQVSWARVNVSKRVGTSLVEAERNSIGWQPSNRSVTERTSHSIDVELQRLLANLYAVIRIS